MKKLLDNFDSIKIKSLDEMTDIITESCLLHLGVEKEFKNVLTEEHGVWVNNRIAADEITMMIKEKVSKKDCSIEKDARNIKHYAGEFVYNANGINVNINYDVINFINDFIFDQMYDYYNMDGGFKEETNTIFVRIAMLNGKFLVATANSTLQHELCHLLDYGFYKNSDNKDKDNSVYKMAVYQMKNPISLDSYELARAIYLTFKSEQIAMANSLDNMLINDKNHILDYRDTDEYKYLINIKNVINNFDNNYKYLVGKVYRCSEESVLKRLKTAYNDYSRRLGRVIVANEYRIINKK